MITIVLIVIGIAIGIIGIISVWLILIAMAIIGMIITDITPAATTITIIITIMAINLQIHLDLVGESLVRIVDGTKAIQ